MGKYSLFIIMFLIISCQSPNQQELSSEDELAIRATSEKWLTAAKEGNWEKVVETYTDDAILWYQNEEAIIGKEALLEYFQSQSPMSILDLQINEIEGRGNLAFVSGTVSVTPEKGVTIVVGKYLDIRKKQHDGSWLFYRDMVIELSGPE